MPSSKPDAPHVIGTLPRPPHPHLQRSRLINLLMSSACRLNLLLAPAGYGKSTLMADCARMAEHPVAWIPLHGRDMTAAELYQRVGNVLQPGFGSWSDSAIETALLQHPQKLWLMLDDFPHGVNEELDAAFGRLVATHTQNIKWWVSSRKRIDCNLARLILEGDLLEVDFEALAFSAGEILDLLPPSELTSTRAQELFALSEGWCAALAFFMMANVDAEALLSEYLRHELLNELSVGERDRLIVLANFSSVDDHLCEHIFGTPEDRGLLKKLSARGAFIAPSKTDSGRFHILPPVARLLAPLAPAAELRKLRRLACQHYLQRGELRSAIEQAVLAEQFEVAASLLEKLNEAELLHEQAAAKVIAYRQQLPVELLESTPRLVTLYAYTYAVGTRPDDAMRCLEALGRFLPAPSAKEQRHLLACWQGIRGIAAHSAGNANAAYTSCHEALGVLTSDDWPLQLGCWAVLIQQRLFRGELNEAEAHIQEALRIAQGLGNAVAESFVRIYQSLLLESRGELQQALQVIEGQLQLLEKHAASRAAIRGRLIVRQAYINLRMGQLKVARQLFTEGYRLGLLNADAIGFHGLAGLATQALLDGDPARAESLLDQAERWLRDNKVAEPIYRSIIDQGRAAALIERADYTRARGLLDAVIARHSGSQGLVQAFEKADFLFETQRLLARVELHSNQFDEAERRLQVLSETARKCSFTLAACEANLLLAEVALARGDEAAAHTRMSHAIEECERLQFRLPLEYMQRRIPKLIRLSGGKSVSGLLSEREIAVLRLVEAGCSNQEIADRLHISLFTVKSHIQRLSSKLEVKRRTQAVAKAKSLGLL